LKILEMLVLDGELTDIEVANSAIRIDSAGLRSVVALGDPALRPLVGIAKCEDISFHTFCLAVSASERILRKHDVKYRLPWYGGVSMYKEQGSSVRRLKPGGQMDEAEFRSQVVRSIEKKSKELGLEQKAGQARKAVPISFR